MTDISLREGVGMREDMQRAYAAAVNARPDLVRPKWQGGACLIRARRCGGV